MTNLTNQDRAVELLKASKSTQEWNNACNAIKVANNGYPSWWYGAVIAPMLLQETARKWQGSGEIHITKL